VSVNKSQASDSQKTKPTKPKKKEGDISGTEFVKKWGKETYDLGWTAIPNVLIERQQALQLDSLGLNIVLILLKHWWRADDGAPYPSKQKIADMTGKSLSSVQRSVRKLEERGLVKREKRYAKDSSAQLSNGYALDGLAAQIRKVAAAEAKQRKQREKEDGRKRRSKKIPET